MTDPAEKYRHGDCYPFALALGERFGWRLGALVVRQPHGDGLHVVHAYGIDESGTLRDALGTLTQDEMVAEYLTDPRRFVSYEFKEFDNESHLVEFLRMCWGSDQTWPKIVSDWLQPNKLQALQDIDVLEAFIDRVNAPLM